MKRMQIVLIVATVGVIVASASMAVVPPEACPVILNERYGGGNDFWGSIGRFFRVFTAAWYGS